MRALLLALLLLAIGCGGGGADRDDPRSRPAERLWVAASTTVESPPVNRTLLLRSDDGGATWQPAFTADHLVYDLAFADADHGTAIGGSHIVGTGDGGRHWMPIRSADAEHLAAVAFASPARGLAIGSIDDDDDETVSPLVLETIDGGARWRRIVMPTLPAGSVGGLTDVCFDGGGHALVIGHTGGDTPLAFREEASGWSNVSDRFTKALVAASGAGGTLWVLESDGLLRSSTDGIAWVPKPTPLGHLVFDVAFADGVHGWVTGAREIEVGPGTKQWSPALYRTADAGRTWSDASLVAEPTLLGLFLDLAVAPDGTHAIAAGSQSDDGAPLLVDSDDVSTRRLDLPAGLGETRAVAIVPR